MSQSLIASDAITIDSIFKNNQGVRSITTIDFISSSGGRSYSIYPALIGVDYGAILVDSKTLSVNETILYAVDSKTDIMLSANGTYKNLQYANADGFSSENDVSFSSVWVGVNYQFDSILGEFKPSVDFQVPVFEKTSYQSKTKSSSLKAFSSRFSLRNYSDPLVSSFYISVLKNFEKSIGSTNIKYPDSYALGLDLSLILNPKVSLNFNFAQRYQTKLRVS